MERRRRREPHSQRERRRGLQDGKRIFVSGIRKPEAEYLNGDSQIYEIQLSDPARVVPMTDRKGPDTNPSLADARSRHCDSRLVASAFRRKNIQTVMCFHFPWWKRAVESTARVKCPRTMASQMPDAWS